MPGNEQGRSSQPDKQRKAQAQAPQHKRREMMSAHLSEDLLVQYDRRSMPLRVGDQVEIMRGDFAGETGEILEIDYDAQEIEVDGAVNRSADGSQVPRPIHPSNVRITQLDLTDPRRRAKLERKGVEVEEPEPEPEPEPEETADRQAGSEAEEPSTPAETPDVSEEPEPVTEDAEGTETAPSPETDEADEPSAEDTETSEDAAEPDEAQADTEDAEDTADADDDNETTQEGSS